jgi:hypothetical protein
MHLTFIPEAKVKNIDLFLKKLIKLTKNSFLEIFFSNISPIPS